LPPGQITEAWYDLDAVKGCGRPGELTLSLQVALRGSAAWESSPFVPKAVIVTVVGTSQLKSSDSSGQSDPYAIVQLKEGKRKYKTQVKKNTAAPVWNETVQFLLTAVESDVLLVGVFDKDVVFDDAIGKVEIPLSGLPVGQVKDGKYPLVVPKGGKPAGEIELKIQVVDAPSVTVDPKRPGRIPSDKVPRT
jgi:Ca2+-dependent lipid-binding protein